MEEHRGRSARCAAGHNHDAHVRAAVELLIEHETWIRRTDFQRARIEPHGREAVINWRKAREFVDAGPAASTSEMAILDLASAIGENRYKFSIMGPANSRMIAQAVARALGEDPSKSGSTGPQTNAGRPQATCTNLFSSSKVAGHDGLEHYCDPGRKGAVNGYKLAGWSAVAAGSPAARCTPAHCTWGDVGAMYANAGFVVGLIVIVVVALLVRAAWRHSGGRL